LLQAIVEASAFVVSLPCTFGSFISLALPAKTPLQSSQFHIKIYFNKRSSFIAFVSA
jgi:hypothetical protein